MHTGVPIKAHEQSVKKTKQQEEKGDRHDLWLSSKKSTTLWLALAMNEMWRYVSCESSKPKKGSGLHCEEGLVTNNYPNNIVEATAISMTDSKENDCSFSFFGVGRKGQEACLRKQSLTKQPRGPQAEQTEFARQDCQTSKEQRYVDTLSQFTNRVKHCKTENPNTGKVTIKASFEFKSKLEMALRQNQNGKRKLPQELQEFNHTQGWGEESEETCSRKVHNLKRKLRNARQTELW